MIPSQQHQIPFAVNVLRRGGIVAFPTETFYGLAVDPFNPLALNRLFSVKGRAENKPVLVLVRDIEQCSTLMEQPLPVTFSKLAEIFWPGPLTLICQALETVPVELTGNTGTVGVRHSPHPVARDLVNAFGKPITATSANFSGQAAAITAAQVDEIFSGAIDCVLDGGKTPGKNASTLVKCNHNTVECLREGVLGCQSIFDALAP
ncbi:L-threonylcarbamoyladenylate synthase [Desulfogranum japonicum]|uniref:L-threonylcarbamoyladenylate synthase n=1 Tax=Desulfogranum japonicum TaxID=231447 RepID=UPI0004097858|nr:L-threonylcarbamoyladenylate synthase [Desulfogranum japonicum]